MSISTLPSKGGRRRLALPSPATVLLLALVGTLELAVGVKASLLTLAETKTIFSFGDSYTQTGFDPSLGYLPSQQNLTTSSGGGSWASYLSTSPAASLQLEDHTFVFARGGATLNGNATFAGYPNMSFANQVDVFETWFTNNTQDGVEKQQVLGGAPEWDSEDTLFTIWFGINDLEIAFKRNEPWPVVYGSEGGNATLNELDLVVSRLYNLGARHFLFHLVPPYYLTPLWTNDTAAQQTFRETVPLWNNMIRQYGGEIMARYEGASAMVWETEEWFEAILSAPAEFGFLNSTNFCDAYASNIWQPNANISAYDPSCGVSEAEYVWLDRSHWTWSVHQLLAFAVATSLSPFEGFPVPPLADVPATADPTAASPTDPTAPDAIVPLAPIASIDPSIPSPVSIPVDPNAGVGYLTLENGDTLPTGTTYTRHRTKRDQDAALALARAQQQQKRSSLQTRVHAAPTGAPARVPVDPNAGLVYSTLANGDTVPLAGVWARQKRSHIEQVERRDPRVGHGRLRKIEPTAVAWSAELSRDGRVGKRDGFWKEMRARVGESVVKGD
ncbi:hypothetical protein JCM10213v2_008524 [Rhodosporidiobolus nylandii]